jgi:antirestriction protein ArdC
LDNPKQNIIKNIAQELDCGNECYYNPKTGEIIAIPNFTNFSDEEEFKEIFSKDLGKVNQKKTNFIKIETLESSESFKIMERFVEKLNDQNFKAKLQDILIKKKPFQNFKHNIDHSDFRQKWFDFKHSELEKIVENQLNRDKANAQQRTVAKNK